MRRFDIEERVTIQWYILSISRDFIVYYAS
jgi:hypothetical protein